MFGRVAAGLFRFGDASRRLIAVDESSAWLLEVRLNSPSQKCGTRLRKLERTVDELLAHFQRRPRLWSSFA